MPNLENPNLTAFFHFRFRTQMRFCEWTQRLRWGIRADRCALRPSVQRSAKKENSTALHKARVDTTRVQCPLSHCMIRKSMRSECSVLKRLRWFWLRWFSLRCFNSSKNIRPWVNEVCLLLSVRLYWRRPSGRQRPRGQVSTFQPKQQARMCYYYDIPVNRLLDVTLLLMFSSPFCAQALFSVILLQGFWQKYPQTRFLLFALLYFYAEWDNERRFPSYRYVELKP